MNVELVKVVVGRRRVLVDGMFVGEIECVHHPGHDIKDSWYDYRGCAALRATVAADGR